MSYGVPNGEWPKVVNLGPGVHAVSWFGLVVANFTTASQAKSYVKYLKFFVSRFRKAFLTDSGNFTQAFTQFLADAANPAAGFVPTWNIL